LELVKQTWQFEYIGRLNKNRHLGPMCTGPVVGVLVEGGV